MQQAVLDTHLRCQLTRMEDQAMVLQRGLAEIMSIQYQQAHLSLVRTECKWATKQDTDFGVYE